MKSLPVLSSDSSSSTACEIPAPTLFTHCRPVRSQVFFVQSEHPQPSFCWHVPSLLHIPVNPHTPCESHVTPMFWQLVVLLQTLILLQDWPGLQLTILMDLVSVFAFLLNISSASALNLKNPIGSFGATSVLKFLSFCLLRFDFVTSFRSLTSVNMADLPSLLNLTATLISWPCEK